LSPPHWWSTPFLFQFVSTFPCGVRTNDNAIRLLQYLEDQYDIREAEKAAAELESGVAELYSLAELAGLWPPF